MPESIDPESIPLSSSLSSPPDQVALELASIVEFMRQDPDNLVFRRFEKLNIYNLLMLQHRLAVCEEEISTHEQRWDGVALAESLLKLEALMKSYSEFESSSQFLNLLDSDEAFVAQVTMSKLHSTPQHLVSTLRAHAKSCLKPLQHELNSPEGWSDLLSLVSTEKGWIQTFIDKHYYLSRLFRKVPSDLFLAMIFWKKMESVVSILTDSEIIPSRLERKTLNQVSSFTQREALGLQSRLLSTRLLASLFLLQ